MPVLSVNCKPWPELLLKQRLLHWPFVTGLKCVAGNECDCIDCTLNLRWKTHLINMHLLCAVWFVWTVEKCFRMNLSNRSQNIMPASKHTESGKCSEKVHFSCLCQLFFLEGMFYTLFQITIFFMLQEFIQ